MSMWFILLVIIGLLVAIGLWGVGLYNGLVKPATRTGTRSRRSTCSCSVALT